MLIHNTRDIGGKLLSIRKKAGLTQSELGDRLGVSRDAIAGYERGVNIPEPTIKLICREFNVDYFWLTEGTGEMFTSIPQTLVDSIADEYHLTDEYKAILEAFLQVPDEDKPAIQNFFLSIAKNANKKSEE